MVRLRPVSKDNLREIAAIELTSEQRRLLEPGSHLFAIAAAYVRLDDRIWEPLAIEADDVVVGAVTLVYPVDRSRISLCGFVIDRRRQRQGLGGEALIQVISIAHDRAPAAKYLNLLAKKDNAAAIMLYQRAGFMEHGLWHDEIELRLAF